MTTIKENEICPCVRCQQCDLCLNGRHAPGNDHYQFYTYGGAWHPKKQSKRANPQQE